MGQLTALKLKSANGKDKPYKLMDGDGLQVRVATDGEKVFLVRYMLDGSERQYRLPETYGDGPGFIDLKMARAKAAHIRALARQGIDYPAMLEQERIQAEKARLKSASEALTVLDLFLAWHESISVKRGRKGRKDGGAEVKRVFEKYVLSRIGAKPLAQLIAHDVRVILTSISAAGHNRQATALLTDIRQMIGWGDKNQPYRRLLADCDVLAIQPEDIVSAGYDPTRDNERTRVLTEPEINQLGQLLPDSGLSIHVRCAVLLMLSTGCRVTETVMARWADIDLEHKLWIIPAANTKTRVAITIYLSDFAAAQFERLKRMTEKLPACDRSPFVFPSSRDKGRPLDAQTIGKALKDRQRPDGEAIKGRTEKVSALVLPGGQWRCHDLRRTFATLAQRLKVTEDIAHRCLNHARNDPLDRVYLQYDYSTEMRDAWSKVGSHIGNLLTNHAIALKTA